MSPADLVEVLQALPRIEDENLIVGMETIDDAGVYRLNDEIALVQTVDIFTPIVDDPYIYGAIVAANSMSDVYAMGGKPLLAMNVIGFPIKELDASVMTAILKGGMEKVKEAGVILVGGHTIDDPELKYGLSVTGIVSPDKVITNANAKKGDKLILTKPLGMGIIGAAIKAEMLSQGDELVQKSCEVMTALNRVASELMQKIGVNACTDITGFGLLGHAFEMAKGSKVALSISASKVPILDGIYELAKPDVVPGRSYVNQEFLTDYVKVAENVPVELPGILFDPQTSGGLLISVAESKAELLLGEMHASGVEYAAIIGEVVPEPVGKLIVNE
jgi:selenide,water dikinase